MSVRNSHCSYCGAAFAPNQAWPRVCSVCHQISYLNPIPVTVVVLPIGDGVLVVRRNIEPRKGWLALPGGYINFGETWQEAGARELFEETGIAITPQDLSVITVHSTPNGQVIIFAQAKPHHSPHLPDLVPNDETQEIAILHEPEELAFPMHTRIAAQFLTANYTFKP